LVLWFYFFVVLSVTDSPIWYLIIRKTFCRVYWIYDKKKRICFYHHDSRTKRIYW